MFHECWNFLVFTEKPLSGTVIGCGINHKTTDTILCSHGTYITAGADSVKKGIRIIQVGEDMQEKALGKPAGFSRSLGKINKQVDSEEKAE